VHCASSSSAEAAPDTSTAWLTEDVILEYEGVKVVMDPDSAPLLEGAQVDYVEDLMKSGFTVYNPNAVKSCACGTSFQTAEGGGAARPCC
jgi:iron-sulfur cluster assembly protein